MRIAVFVVGRQCQNNGVTAKCREMIPLWLVLNNISRIVRARLVLCWIPASSIVTASPGQTEKLLHQTEFSPDNVAAQRSSPVAQQVGTTSVSRHVNQKISRKIVEIIFYSDQS